MPSKTQQLQIRVTPQQKAALRRMAAAAGRDVSSYVLSRLVLAEPVRFGELLRELGSTSDHRYVLAELSDLLHRCGPFAFGEAVSGANLSGLSAFLANYVAAMVELAADQKGVTPPAWTREVAPLDTPWFATPMVSLRMHLLRAAPVPFKRRNIFVDASVGARV